MKWIAPTACALFVLVVGLFYLRNTPRSLADAGGCTVAEAGSRSSAVVCFPAVDADWWSYYEKAHESCAQPVHDLAVHLRTKPTAVAVARAYSRKATDWTTDKRRLGAVYAGCLAALRTD